MKSKYEYIIKYSFRGGSGASKIVVTKPINSLKDVSLIEKDIEKQECLRNVYIDGYTLVSSRIGKRKFIK